LELTVRGEVLTPLSTGFVDTFTDDELGYVLALPRIVEGLSVAYQLDAGSTEFEIRVGVPARRHL
jgi:hypothetical protein